MVEGYLDIVTIEQKVDSYGEKKEHGADSN